MALVGDIIVRARRLIPDPCSTLPAPTATFGVVTVGGSTLATGTYYAQVTQWNPWGETLPTSESAALVVGSNQGIQITSALLPGATKIRVYLTAPGGGAGNESQYVESTSSPFTVSAPPAASGTVPTTNTAFNPDTDGQFASASTIYDWLSEGLRELSRTAGGIRTYSGVQAIAGQPMYTLAGNWNAITDVWYAGYWMQGGQRGNFFRANSIVAQILTSATVSVQDNRTILEVYPQPANSGGSTTLSAAMSISDTTAFVTDSGFLSLPFGFMQVDNEIMAYSNINTGSVTGLVRGLGINDPPVAHADGAPVLELNMALNGRAVFATSYVPGQSAITLPCPPGWSDILTDYVMWYARSAEQEYQMASQHLKQFSQKTAQWARTNLNAVKRRQIGPSSVPEAYYGGVPGGGGWIIPTILVGLTLANGMLPFMWRLFT